MKRIVFGAACILIMTLLTGCLPKTGGDQLKQEPELEEELISKVDYQGIRPNELGDILVVMYHGLVASDPPSIFQRTILGFKEDLLFLYEHKYIPISAEAYYTQKIDIPAGYTPILLTFDDSLSTTFSLQSAEAKLQINEDCAVDIMDDFAEEHPEFGKAAIFFINQEPFTRDYFTDLRGTGTVAQRLGYLIQEGYEIGNHTYGHDKLNQINKAEIAATLGKIDQLIKVIRPETKHYFLAYPFGLLPQGENSELIKKGFFEEKEYHYDLAFREAPREPYFVPRFHQNFEAYKIPRVCGTEGNVMDLGWYLAYYEEHPEKKYISDGLPERLSLPEEMKDKLDRTKVEAHEIYIYDAKTGVQVVEENI